MQYDVDSLETPVDFRNYELLVHAERKDLRDRFYHKVVSKKLSHIEETYYSVDESISISIKLGYFRALLNKFCEEREIPRSWFVEKRREIGISGWNTEEDLSILQESYPEFGEYHPEEGVTDEEIIDGATTEYNNLVQSFGSAQYHSRIIMQVAKYKEDSPHAKQAERDLADLGDDSLLGSTVEKAFQEVIKEFGVRPAIYWLASLVEFDNRWNALFELMSNNPRERQIHVLDMSRKIPQITEYLKERAS